MINAGIIVPIRHRPPRPAPSPQAVRPWFRVNAAATTTTSARSVTIAATGPLAEPLAPPSGTPRHGRTPRLAAIGKVRAPTDSRGGTRLPFIRNLLTRGNGKLGEGVHAWSIPAVETCPGRSGLCSRVCYARSGRFRTRTMQSRLAENLAAARADDFAARVVAEVRRRGVHVLRIHVSGDFYDAEYAQKWATIARRCPGTTFYAYTRSWRVPTIAPALAELAGLPNVRLWYSCDAETGPPPELPPGIRIAYLQTDGHEQPIGDLVFRVRPLRGPMASRPALAVVCPTELSVPRRPDVTCTSCRLCHR